MFTVSSHPFLVPFDGSFKHKKAICQPPNKAPSNSECKTKLQTLIEELHDLQRILYAQDNHAILLIFQGMDAAGKDSTIRAVMTGINPAGCQVYSFKQPSHEELGHDFLWRTSKRLPERGKIGIFNRSYYEEALVVRVHPEILANQRLPDTITKNIWDERLESICDHEKHLARNGTIILKFWLHLSKEEQRQRLLARIDNKKKNWKFTNSDIEERSYWKEYMKAFEKTLNASSKPWAPWYAIPADSKPFMQLSIAEILVNTLKQLGLKYPTLNKEQENELQKIRKLLAKDS